MPIDWIQENEKKKTLIQNLCQMQEVWASNITNRAKYSIGVKEHKIKLPST